MAHKRVAVIGAGAAGLVTARELRVEGHAVVVLEQDAKLGGVWNYSEDVESDLLGLDPTRERIHSSLYSTVRTNLPREIMSFSDWPFVPEAMRGLSVDQRRFPKHEEVQAYLELFAEEFHLLDLIRFQQRCISVLPLPGTGSVPEGSLGWEVTSKSTADPQAEARTEVFDAVVCCVGTYHDPNLPDVRGMADFPGRQLHCHNYRHNESFRGEAVLVVGASFSGDEIARLIADVATVVYQTARTWATEEVKQPRDNLHRVSWLKELTSTGEAVFSDGERLKISSIVYCTGYKYSFPFLEASKLVTTEDGHVHPTYKHIFVPRAPTLSFVGLLWKSLRFPQFELQGKLVARVLSGRAQLPEKECMEEAIEAFYQALRDNGLPIRYTHSQSGIMPEDQWSYNDSLAAMCGPDVELLPWWRRNLHNVGQSAIFGRPETFRDQWTEEEEVAFSSAAEECREMLLRHQSRALKAQ